MKKINFEEIPEIYTTGAYLRPLKTVDNLGNDVWVWYVSNFESDTFKDGKSVNSQEIAKVKRDLIKSERKINF